MINRRFWLAAALVLGIMTAGCDQDKNYELPAAIEKVVINGIPEEYNGKNIFFSGKAADGATICGFTNMSDPGKGNSEKIKLAKISDGTAEMSLYKIHQDASSFSDYIQAYSEDDINGHIYIVDDDRFLTWEEVSKIRSQCIYMGPIRSEASDGNFTVDWFEEPVVSSMLLRRTAGFYRQND